MTKRYRERLDTVQLAEQADGRDDAARRGEPVGFQWRGQAYQVVAVLGHWREDPGWWRRADGQPIRIEQTDLWRVEAGSARNRRAGTPTRGVYELVHRAGEWTLDRVWD